MKNRKNNSRKKINYFTAPRAILETDFPTLGFYFIHSIGMAEDSNGNFFHVARVDWRLNNTGPWVNPEEIKYLRLDYLYNGVSEYHGLRKGPIIPMWALKKLIIEVKYSSMKYSRNTPKGKAYILWGLANVSLANNELDVPNHKL